MPLAAGDRLGPYEVVALIGAGGMGEVYKGRDTRLDRSVAIKILKPGARERFEREARAISALNHANICGLYDVGTQGVSDFLVMEYIEAETLEQHLRKGPVPMEQAVAYGIEIASALCAAHQACIVHRDLKPANVMLVRAGVKLLDFGLAKPGITGIGDTTATIGITGEHVLIGTLHYMAPEQLEGKDADHRSDIFAFGLVLYEMLTGQQAFTGHNAASLIAAILTARVPSLVPKQPATPRELDHVIQRCLATAGSSSAAAVRVSVDGGRHPQWRGDGGELYYLSPAYQVVSVPVKAGAGEVNVGRPTVLFSLGWRSRGAAGDLLRYAVSRDGKPFFFGRSPNDAAAFPLTILIGSPEW
jgi:eukaryotic-like serine/threonine-protein kinase